jgi:hypothetical protein
MANITYSKNFINSQTDNSAGDIYCGVKDDSVPDQYKIIIETQRRTRTIKNPKNEKVTFSQVIGYMQKPIRFETSSNWTEFSAVKGFTLIESAAQAVGVSLQGRFSSRRSWTGTSPLKFKISLEFLAEKDIQSEVIQPVKELLKLPLPESIFSEGSFGDQVAIYAPGPVPYKVNIAGKNYEGPDLYREQTDITIGNQWIFSNVIVRNIVATQYPYFSRANGAVKASVDVDFETYEIFSKSDIDKASLV